jgi:hypothetical protein
LVGRFFVSVLLKDVRFSVMVFAMLLSALLMLVLIRLFISALFGKRLLIWR